MSEIETKCLTLSTSWIMLFVIHILLGSVRRRSVIDLLKIAPCDRYVNYFMNIVLVQRLTEKLIPRSKEFKECVRYESSAEACFDKRQAKKT